MNYISDKIHPSINSSPEKLGEDFTYHLPYHHTFLPILAPHYLKNVPTELSLKVQLITYPSLSTDSIGSYNFLKSVPMINTMWYINFLTKIASISFGTLAYQVSNIFTKFFTK